MCGITGFVASGDPRPFTEPLLRSNALLRHRGPDDYGHAVIGQAGLAMSRLSIVDLEGGRQPIATPDGSHTIVFNGEIYNFEVLRRSPELAGYPFRTLSDTEVVLALYQRLGPACLDRLRGMFAFAVWDCAQGRLFLARDRLGKKPLFYAATSRGFYFASELQALSVWPAIDRSLDLSALDAFLALQYIPSPLSIFRGVRKLPPAHFLTFQSGSFEVTRYWDVAPPRPLEVSSPSEASALVRSKVQEAVRIRLMGDVPVGAFLSGGVDSSVVVSCMAEASERPVQTFSIGFDHDAYSELEEARGVARLFATDHHEFVVTADLASVLPDLVRHYGEPFADSSALPSFFLAREASRHVKVALNGDGGDELFAGYYRHPLLRWANALLPPAVFSPVARAALALSRRIPGGAPVRLRRGLETLSEGTDAERILRMNAAFSSSLRARSYTTGFRRALGRFLADRAEHHAGTSIAEAFDRGRCFDPLNRLLYVDLACGLPDDLLVKIDIATMANSLEARSPLLDHLLVECAFSLPGAWKLRRGRSKKWLLKEAFRDRFPAGMLDRPKRGFGIPAAPWLRGPLRAMLRDRVFDSGALSRRILAPEALEQLWEEHQSGREDHSPRLWPLLMLELWNDYARPDLAALAA